MFTLNYFPKEIVTEKKSKGILPERYEDVDRNERRRYDNRDRYERPDRDRGNRYDRFDKERTRDRRGEERRRRSRSRSRRVDFDIIIEFLSSIFSSTDLENVIVSKKEDLDLNHLNFATICVVQDHVHLVIEEEKEVVNVNPHQNDKHFLKGTHNDGV